MLLFRHLYCNIRFLTDLTEVRLWPDPSAIRMHPSFQRRPRSRCVFPVLSVMISGRLHENNRDTYNIQVMITQSEKCEELSLQDMDGVFLRIPASECASPRTSSVSSNELSVELQNTSVLQEDNGFSVEEHCLERVLSSMEQKLVKVRTQSLEAQEEVVSLSIKVSEYSGKLLEVQ